MFKYLFVFTNLMVIIKGGGVSGDFKNTLKWELLLNMIETSLIVRDFESKFTGDTLSLLTFT